MILLSGIKEHQDQYQKLNGLRGDGGEQQEGDSLAEVGESLASNEPNEEVEADKVTDQGGGYNLRPRIRSQTKEGNQQGITGMKTKGAQVGGTDGIGTSFGLKKQIGFIELQDRIEDQHQLVLYTKTPDGQHLLAKDLIEIDTEGGKWLEIGQAGSIKENEKEDDQLILPGEELNKLTEINFTQISNCNGNVYHIEFPEESDHILPEQDYISLDCATEKELIGTWNARLNLKRDRRMQLELEAVEEELLRRKRQKREAWYDNQGRLLCVTISDENGTKTLVRNEKGQLEPQSN